MWIKSSYRLQSVLSKYLKNKTLRNSENWDLSIEQVRNRGLGNFLWGFIFGVANERGRHAGADGLVASTS